MIMTSAVAAMTHAVSPVSSAKFRSPPNPISAGISTGRITLRSPRGICHGVIRRAPPAFRSGLREQLDPNAVRILDVRPSAGRGLYVEDDGMARLLRFRERLVEVLDLERQVVEPLPDDVVRREAGPFLVVVQLEDESVVLAREVGRDPFRRVNRASS